MATNSGRAALPEGAKPTGTTVTGGQKPLHRFLRGEPKSVGIVMLFLGSSLFIFGIPLKADNAESSADLYSSFWLGILYFICGILYVQAERAPTKKIVTISLALSIIAILGSVFAAIDFIKAMINISFTAQMEYNELAAYHDGHNYTILATHAMEHFMQLYNLEAVFLFHTLVGGVILIIMSTFARMAIRSSRTQMVVVMRNLPSTE